MPRRQVAVRQSANVFSYHASRSPHEANLGRHEQPAERQAQPFHWQLLPTWLAVVAILVSAIYITTLTSNPYIVIANNEGSLARPESVYQDYARSVLKSSFFSRSKLTVDTDGAAKKIQDHFPELDSVSITVPVIARRPIVQLQASAPPFALSSKNGVYYLREDGTASVEVSAIKDLAAPPQIVIDQSSLPLAAGKVALPKATVASITEIIRQMKAKQIAIDQLTLPAVPDELQMRIKGLPYYVRFSTSSDPAVQAGAFLAVKQKLEGDHITPKEYVDVRVEERAYYR